MFCCILFVCLVRKFVLVAKLPISSPLIGEQRLGGRAMAIGHIGREQHARHTPVTAMLSLPMMILMQVAAAGAPQTWGDILTGQKGDNDKEPRKHPTRTCNTQHTTRMLTAPPNVTYVSPFLPPLGTYPIDGSFSPRHKQALRRPTPPSMASCTNRPTHQPRTKRKSNTKQHAHTRLTRRHVQFEFLIRVCLNRY